LIDSIHPQLYRFESDLATRFPEFSRAYRDEYVIDGQLLPTVMLERVLILIEDLYRESSKGSRVAGLTFVGGLLEGLAVLADPNVHNILRTSILEGFATLGKLREDFMSYLGPATEKLIHDMHQKSQFDPLTADPLA